MKKNIVVKQSNINDCGVCSLASIIKYYGATYNLEKLRHLMNTTKNGTNAYNIVECAKILGFSSRGLKVNNLNEINNNICPFIAHVVISKSYMHYIVVYNINYKNRTLKIMDPAIGMCNITFEKFNKMWTNIILTFIPVRKIISLNKNNTFIKTIKNILFNYKSILFTNIILHLLSYILGVFNSLQLKIIIENINNSYSNNIKILHLLIFLSIIIKCIFDYLKNDLIIYLNNKIEFNLVISTFSHILKLPYDYFKTKTSGDIISRINDLNSIKNSIINFIICIFVNTIIFIISLILLFKISQYLFKLVLLLSLLLTIFSILLIPNINKLIDKVQISNSNQTSYMLESINAFESIKSLNNHNKIINNYENKLIDCLNNKILLQKIINKDNILKEFLYLLSTFLMFYLGYKQILDNKLTIGNLILFSSLYNYFINSIKSLISLIPDIEYFSRTINRINDMFEINHEKFISYKYDYKSIYGDIKFCNVSYLINNTDIILNNINIDIKYGSRLAIIGQTGSGKSTLLKLLLRYYKLDCGAILINNKNILDYDILNLRENICYVSQNEVLFTDSIYNNIIMNRNINYDYFLKICRICEVDKIVENKYLRYDYLLEENGFNISGGEKARIILARALLNSSTIYILDEALKELDSLSEKRILNNIFKEFGKNTFLVVTHKMDNLNIFDNILYVNNKSVNYVTDL